MSIERLDSLSGKPGYLSGELLDRYWLLAEKLEHKIGFSHPRLSMPNLRTTISDNSAAELTYLEVVDYSPTDYSPQLPPNAYPCEDPEVLITLMEDHIRSIDMELPFTEITHLAGINVYELQNIYPSDESEWLKWLAPIVSGQVWHRGYQIYTSKEDAVIILQPSKVINVPSGSPFPEMYLIGSPKKEVILAAVNDFGQLTPANVIND